MNHGPQPDRVADLLFTHAQAAYGWADTVAVSEGPRGALGQIWRVDVGSRSFALKEIFDEVPTEDVIRREIEFARCATEFDVHVPACIPAADGSYLVTTPQGRWLRCYEWVDLHPVPVTHEFPRRLGSLLAHLHQCAPATGVEPDGGGPADPWYHRPPDRDDWSVTAIDAPWAARVRAQLATINELSTLARPTEAARLILCHRDLHPENVFVDADGRLVVVDWGDFGPAEPGRELARVVFDWFCDRDRTDLDAVGAAVDSYRRCGGQGRINHIGDFSMLVAGRLNFLLAQARIAADADAEPRHRQWAEREIDVALHLLPTRRQLDDVLAVAQRS